MIFTVIENFSEAVQMRKSIRATSYVVTKPMYQKLHRLNKISSVDRTDKEKQSRRSIIGFLKKFKTGDSRAGRRASWEHKKLWLRGNERRLKLARKSRRYRWNS